MSVNARVLIDIAGTLAGVNDLGAPVMPFALRDSADFTPGTLAGQANIVFADNRSIAASSNDDLDLNGTLPAVFDGTVNLVSVKSVAIRAAATNVNDLIVGGAPTNTFIGPFGAAAQTFRIRPGDVLAFTARNTGWTVTPGTCDILRIANSGAGSAVVYDIIIIGH